MQTTFIENSRGFGGRERGDLIKTTSSIHLRAFRFFSERYLQRERPSYFADLFLWGLIMITSAWPMFSLVQAMDTLK